MNAKNSLKSLDVSSDSEPEVEPFITQTKAASVAILQELSENNLNLHLRVQKTSKQLTISIFTPRIFRPTCTFTDKEDSGRGITTETDKEISRGMKQEYHKTQRSTTCLRRVHEFGMTGWRTYMKYTTEKWKLKRILSCRFEGKWKDQAINLPWRNSPLFS